MTTPSDSSESIPEVYDRLLGPLLFQPHAEDLAARLDSRPGMRILEIGCGTGIVTRALLARLPHDAELLATDLSEPMLVTARQRVRADARLAWQQADATRLPFDDDRFDAVVCQFALMFFADKAKAFADMHRVLKPGGRILLNTWDSFERNRFSRVAQRALTNAFLADVSRFFEVPHSFHDTAVIHEMAQAAGFSEIRIEVVTAEGHSPSALDAATGLMRGLPVLTALRERGVSIEQMVAATAHELDAEYGPGPLRVPLRALVTTALA